MFAIVQDIVDSAVCDKFISDRYGCQFSWNDGTRANIMPSLIFVESETVFDFAIHSPGHRDLVNRFQCPSKSLPIEKHSFVRISPSQFRLDLTGFSRIFDLTPTVE